MPMLSALETNHSSVLVFGVPPPLRSSANHDFLRLRRRARWLHTSSSNKKNSFTPHRQGSSDHHPPLLSSTNGTSAESPAHQQRRHDGSLERRGARGAGSFVAVRTAMRWVACCGGNANANGPNGNGTYGVPLQQQQVHVDSASVSPREAHEQPPAMRQPLLEAETAAGDDSDPRSRLLPTGGDDTDGEKTPRAPSSNHHHRATAHSIGLESQSYSVQYSPRGSTYGGECALGSGAGGGSSSMVSSASVTGGRASQATIQMAEKYGPMLLRPYKVALHVVSPTTFSGSLHAFTSSFSLTSSANAEIPFIERLKNGGWAVHQVSPSDAMPEAQLRRPVLILFDHKVPDLQVLSRSLHELPETENALFATLVDRPPTEKRLQAFSKADVHLSFLYSSTDISLCELFARVASRLRAIPALFAVVEEAEQPIKICDDRNVVQYVNRAYEIATGRSRSEVLGTDASEMRLKTLNTLSSPPATRSTIIATAAADTENCASGGGSFSASVAPDTASINRRRSSEWHCITVPTSSTSPQFVYVKRGSADAAIGRDLSLKSLRSQNALVDAPITEALSVLNNVLHKCDDETQMQLREAIKTLSSTELYTPTITRFRETDRIATGYYDGLIRLHHPSRQRKRSVVDAFRETQRRSSGAEGRRRISSDVANALETENSWHFDVIQLERITDHRALSHLGIKIFERWNVCDTLRCSSDTVARWFALIESNYQSSNPYHNSTHAADVLQATSFFLDSDSVGQNVQDVHAVAVLIAAAIHDLDHPGRGNGFLMNTRHRLAILYNDQSILESHHVALAFQLTLGQPTANIFARMSREDFTGLRQAVIDMVLATDMSRHFEYLTKFQQMLTNMQEGDREENRDANSMTICRMLIKCADIANPTRDWKLCQQWAMRIVQEYFDQTSEESEKGLPVTMKGFDRETCNVPMTQCYFVDMFARETFTLWCEFADLPLLPEQLEKNYENWKKMAASWDPAKSNVLLLE